MDELIPLSDATLDRLPFAAPRYDRARLTPGVVHIGVGNFHRAHQAWYLHQLMQNGMARDWAIIGAGVRSFDAAMRKKLRAQDCLTTLIQLDPDATSAEAIGSMVDYLPIEDGNGALIRTMADPAVRIVSLTVTEGGYYVDPASKAVDAAHPDLLHDAANPTAPGSAFGAIVAALKARRDSGAGPFTALSCDNIQGNGEALRAVVTTLARLSDPGLADWIDATVSFPNSMVDCIAPATGPKELELVRSFGVADAAPVTHEAYRQWVIEDDFCAGRPPLEDVGATFSDNVGAYESMKIRILNAGHQVLANVGEILGVETIADCMAHPLIAAFFRKVLIEEIAPTVGPVPGRTPADYVDLISQRFSNPRIVDTTRRVAFDGSSRHPGFVLPILRDQLAASGSVSGLALVEAFWARMCAGIREDGSEIAANDPIWSELVEVARTARERPQAWLAQRRIYGELATDPRFSASFESALSSVWQHGCDALLRQYLASAPAAA